MKLWFSVWWTRQILYLKVVYEIGFAGEESIFGVMTCQFDCVFWEWTNAVLKWLWGEVK